MRSILRCREEEKKSLTIVSDWEIQVFLSKMNRGLWDSKTIHFNPPAYKNARHNSLKDFQILPVSLLKITIITRKRVNSSPKRSSVVDQLKSTTNTKAKVTVKIRIPYEEVRKFNRWS